MTAGDEFEITELVEEHYEEAYALWEQSEGIGLSEADSKERILAYLRRNPGTSYVALKDGRVVGTVLGGHDGRRGYLHHLAVDSHFRRQGLGRALLSRCEESLVRIGLEKCHIFVYAENTAGKAFWKSAGWFSRSELGVMSKVFRESSGGKTSNNRPASQ